MHKLSFEHIKTETSAGQTSPHIFKKWFGLEKYRLESHPHREMVVKILVRYHPGKKEEKKKPGCYPHMCGVLKEDLAGKLEGASPEGGE